MENGRKATTKKTGVGRRSEWKRMEGDEALGREWYE